MDVINDNSDTISIDTLYLESSILQDKELKDVEMKELESLGKYVSQLHTEVLFYRKPGSKIGSACHEAWKAMVKIIGGTKSSTARYVGSTLGISNIDLDYIIDSSNDPADIILKVFAQNDNATLDQVVDIFIEMGRYDLLTAIKQPLKDLAQWFNTEDSGYESGATITNNSKAKKIYRLKTELLNDVPPVLRKKYTQNKEPNRPVPSLRPSKTSECSTTHDTPILFLTYAKDGVATAANIKYYVQNWTDFPEVNVITLNDKKEEVYQNPEKFIREYFEKADYVVPIVTLEYLQEIKSHNPSVPSTGGNLDCQYVNFIYNLIITHYIHASGCYNKKVRSVLPLNVNVDVLSSITMYPDLMPWTYESNFDEQFKAFLQWGP